MCYCVTWTSHLILRCYCSEMTVTNGSLLLADMDAQMAYSTLGLRSPGSDHGNAIDYTKDDEPSK